MTIRLSNLSRRSQAPPLFEISASCGIEATDINQLLATGMLPPPMIVMLAKDQVQELL